MTRERTADILTPGKVKYSPPEYEKALQMARDALMSAAEQEKSEVAESGNNPAG